MTSRIVLVFVLALLPAVALAQSGIIHPEKPDAEITTSEDIHDHEGRSENIQDHEGGYEDIHGHRGASEDIHRHEAGSEKLADHHADSERINDEVVESERLHGMGALPKTTDERLASARERLRAARARHAHHEAKAREQSALRQSGASAPPASAQSDPELSAASQRADDRYAHWTARIDVARERIGVAEASLAVWDESYAQMIQSDYPRGDARQKLIDSRDRARDRVASEKARLPRMIEEAKRAGVPAGVLQQHVSEDSPGS